MVCSRPPGETMRVLCKRPVILLGAVLWVAISGAAQSEEKFKIRITPVPLDGSMRATVAGSGSATATFSENKLRITGTFEGMPSAATAAKIHRGLATGVRGSPFLDLTVTPATKGVVSGSFDLSPEQVQYLKQGKLYIQIYSEKATDGTLWGWILK